MTGGERTMASVLGLGLAEREEKVVTGVIYTVR